ncbi:MAG: 30S ribosome-binding factor RbfA [Oscillospiraceae bacterium]|nr:30S ribosome-binding factor RbfA [Oscillospiraceae bacterium]
MASNRIVRINEAIQKELSALLRTVKDPRVQDTMISITRVETTPDLRYTKVYVSFLQEEKVKDAMAGLKSAAGFLRRQLGSNLQLRYAPEIVWALDDSITYGARMLNLINSLGVKHDDEETDAE